MLKQPNLLKSNNTPAIVTTSRCVHTSICNESCHNVILNESSVITGQKSVIHYMRISQIFGAVQRIEDSRMQVKIKSGRGDFIFIVPPTLSICKIYELQQDSLSYFVCLVL